MRIRIDAGACSETNRSELDLERLLRIAFTRYADLLVQVGLVLEDAPGPAEGSWYRARLIVRFRHWSDMEIEELQPSAAMAVDRAIQRTESVLRQSQRRQAWSA